MLTIKEFIFMIAMAALLMLASGIEYELSTEPKPAAAVRG